MKAIEIFHMNPYQGIRIFTQPFSHVALGKSTGKRHTRISLGLQDIKALTVTRPYTNPATRETVNISLIEDVNVLTIPDKKLSTETEKVFRHLLVCPTYPNDDRVLVKWTLPSGYKGKAEITIVKGIYFVAEDRCYLAKDNVEQHEVMCVLKPGQKLVAYRDGERVPEHLRNGELTWDGHTLTTKFGTAEQCLTKSIDVRPKSLAVVPLLKA